ncbi:Scr1 family TA system antitoxin-like transcriptional regulator [Sphaerisporangium sp. NPDC005289]|uniref:DUF397 domain-containing protein n=1 Tax=Sphaerisporangium sp. NPDC005289 TaxID=3155247 RepID=UPI0033ADF202
MILIDTSPLAHVKVQVLPMSAGPHAGLKDQFVILDFPDPNDRSVVYLGTATDGLYLEETHHIDRYSLVFQHLCAAALSVDASIDHLSIMLTNREATMDLSQAEWRKSARSSGDGNDCVEVATNMPGIVAVRDSKDPAGPNLLVTALAWRFFIGGVKAKESALDVVPREDHEGGTIRPAR